MSKDQDNLCSSELHHFGTLTSLKGVGRAIKTEERWLRIVWVAAVVVFLCVTMYNVYTLTHQYLMVTSCFSCSLEMIYFTMIKHLALLQFEKSNMIITARSEGFQLWN